MGEIGSVFEGIGSVFEGTVDSRIALSIRNSRGGGYQHPSPRPTVLSHNSTYDNSVCIDPCSCIEKSSDIAGHFGILDGKVVSGRVGPVVDGGDLGVVGPVVDAGVGTWTDGEEDAMVAMG